MLKSLLKRFIKEDDWVFMAWYRERFGLLPAVFSYAALRGRGLGAAPNPLTGGRVYLRSGAADQSVYDEIFLKREYDLDLGDPAFIIDAGAHIGLASVHFANKYPDATVVAVEPEPANFEILLKNTRGYHNIKPLRAGLWNRRAHLRIQDSTVDTWSFRVTEDAAGGVPAVGVRDIMADFGVDRVDVLKIDIEGAELEVLGHSGPWIDAVNTLIVELHDRFRPGCAEALRAALSGRTYDESQSGESVVVRNIQRGGA